MTQERKTAGLLPGPVWLLVRPGDKDRRMAIGPCRTLDSLRGVTAGVSWSAPDAKILGVADHIPDDCKDVALDDFATRELAGIGTHDYAFTELEPRTFEQQLVNILWYDYKEGRWDEEKEWNADRWQDVGMLLESFGIEFPGEDAPHPADAEGYEEEAGCDRCGAPLKSRCVCDDTIAENREGA